MKILVLRFSAMGDVAMTVPVLNQVLQDYKDLEITLVTQKAFKPFFNNIDRLTVLGQDKNNLKSIKDLYTLSQNVWNKGPYEQVIDLHGSLRTRIISLFLAFKGIQVFTIQKGKKEKKQAIRRRNKVLIPLKTTFNRYLDVFFKAGWNKNQVYIPDQYDEAGTIEGLGIKIKQNWKKEDPFLKRLIHSNPNLEYRDGNQKPVLIGWAPFAGFKLKEMPLENQIAGVHLLLENVPNALIFLLAGPKQRESLKGFWADTPFQDRLFFIGDWADSLEEELSVIQKLDLLVSMDSANMHLGALLDIKVMGIYGTTHPNLGFTPYRQRQSGTYGIENLKCRPCTVFGKGKCYRGDFACMNQIKPIILVEEILKRLS